MINAPQSLLAPVPLSVSVDVAALYFHVASPHLPDVAAETGLTPTEKITVSISTRLMKNDSKRFSVTFFVLTFLFIISPKMRT